MSPLLLLAAIAALAWLCTKREFPELDVVEKVMAREDEDLF